MVSNLLRKVHDREANNWFPCLSAIKDCSGSSEGIRYSFFEAERQLGHFHFIIFDDHFSR